MIRVTDINGCEFYLAATNIASINVAATSSQWHGGSVEIEAAIRAEPALPKPLY